MSIQTQERLVTRLIVVMALAIAVSLVMVGWTLYRPGSSLGAATTINSTR
jgi:nitrate/nitrite-specific signal transduction histidine kinase